MSYKVLAGSMCLSLHNNSSNFKSKKFIPSGMRKKITGFSKEARRNLLKSLQSVSYEELNAQFWDAYFMTLTYQYSLDGVKEDFYFTYKDLRSSKIDLDNFFKRLKYFFDKLKVDWFCFWKMEFFSAAPVPHFHLMLFVAPHSDINCRSLRELVSSMWVSVITKDTSVSDELKSKMLRAATNVRYSPIDRYRILQIYISKEIGKEYQVNIDDYTGRFWGIANRKIFKLFFVQDGFLVSEDTFYRLRRVFVSYLRRKGYKYRIRSSNGMSLFYLLNVDDFIRLISYFEGYCDEGLNSG
jgi:hypothetical protein